MQLSSSDGDPTSTDGTETKKTPPSACGGVFHNGRLVLIGLAVAALLWLLCRLVVYLMHKGEPDATGLDGISNGSLKRLRTNDMAALTGAFAGLATLIIALYANPSVEIAIVCGIIAATLGVVAAAYMIIGNRYDANVMYLQIGDTLKNKDKALGLGNQEKQTSKNAI